MPPIITPSSATLRGLNTLLLTADRPCNWSAPTGGTCTPGSGGLSCTYTPINQTKNFSVLAAPFDASGVSSVTVSVEAEISLHPQLSSSGSTRKHVDVSEGVRGRRWTISRSPALRFYDLEFTDRPDADFQQMSAAWDNNYPALPFFWTDPFLNQERKFLFDSKMNWTRAGRGYYDFKVSLREQKVYQPGAIIPASSVFPFMIDYGFEVEVGKEIESSDAEDWSRAARALPGTRRRRIEMTCFGRSAAEFLQAEAFWIYNYPGRVWTLQHAGVLGLAGSFQMDSFLSWQYKQHNMVDYKFIAREVL